MGVFLQKKGDGWRKHFYGSWQVNGRRECRRLTRWEGIPPKAHGGKGDAVFEASKAEAVRMLARLKSAREEAWERIRWKVEKEIERCAGDGGRREDLAGLVRMLAELQIKVAFAMQAGGQGATGDGTRGGAVEGDALGGVEVEDAGAVEVAGE